MSTVFWNLIWSIELRWGIGLDVESVGSRPVWVVRDEQLGTMAFDGLIFQLPFITISVGNVYEEEEIDS